MRMCFAATRTEERLCAPDVWVCARLVVTACSASLACGDACTSDDVVWPCQESDVSVQAHKGFTNEGSRHGSLQGGSESKGQAFGGIALSGSSKHGGSVHGGGGSAERNRFGQSKSGRHTSQTAAAAVAGISVENLSTVRHAVPEHICLCRRGWGHVVLAYAPTGTVFEFHDDKTQPCTLRSLLAGCFAWHASVEHGPKPRADLCCGGFWCARDRHARVCGAQTRSVPVHGHSSTRRYLILYPAAAKPIRLSVAPCFPSARPPGPAMLMQFRHSQVLSSVMGTVGKVDRFTIHPTSNW
jgi:hypothetical protein